MSQPNHDDAHRKGTTPRPPVDIGQGIPDRATTRPTWKYIALVAIFLVWVAVLIYMATAGQRY